MGIRSTVRGWFSPRPSTPAPAPSPPPSSSSNRTVVTVPSGGGAAQMAAATNAASSAPSGSVIVKTSEVSSLPSGTKTTPLSSYPSAYSGGGGGGSVSSSGYQQPFVTRPAAVQSSETRSTMTGYNPAIGTGGNFARTTAATTTALAYNPNLIKSISPASTPTQYTKDKREAQSQADMLRLGRMEQFGGKSYTDLVGFERRGTAQITKITPYTNLEVAQSIDFYKGAPSVLDERLAKDVEIQKQTFESQVTPSTTELELANINKEYQASVDKINKEYSGYSSEYTKTGYKIAALKSLPLVAASVIVSPLIPAAATSSVGIGLGVASAVSVIANPFSYKTVIDIKKDSGGNIIGYDTARDSFTTPATVGLALSGVTTLVGGYGAIRATEASLYNLETTRMVNTATKTIQPYGKINLVKGDTAISFSQAKLGTTGIGKAYGDYSALGITTKTGQSSFVYSQSGNIRLVGETGWRYPWGDKFVSVQSFASGGSGINLPGATSKEVFSVSRVNQQFSVGGSVGFSKPSDKVFSLLESNIKPTSSNDVGSYYLGKSTQVGKNLYLEKSMNLKGLALDSTTDNLQWAALTGNVKSRGFSKSILMPDSKVKFFASGGGSSNIQTMGGTSVITKTSQSVESSINPQILTPRVSTSITIPIFKTTTIPETNSKYRTSTITIPQQSTKTVSKTDTETIVMPQSTYRYGSNIDAATIVTPISNIGQVSKVIQQPMQPFPSVPIKGRGSPITPLPVSPIVFIPPFKFPSMDSSQTGNKLFKSQRKYDYTPDFKSLFLGITGKAPKKMGSFGYGEKARPIVGKSKTPGILKSLDNRIINNFKFKTKNFLKGRRWGI